MTTSATSTTLQLQLHYNYNYSCNYNYIALRYTTLHPAVVGEVTHSKNHNHLSVHQWIRSAIHASQQLTSPIVSYL